MLGDAGSTCTGPKATERMLVCPFVDRPNERCAEHLSMRGLALAYMHCADRYRSCPVYQELTANEHRNQIALKTATHLAAAS